MNSIIELMTHIYLIFIEMAPYIIIGLFFVGLLHILFSKEFVLRHVGEDNLSSVVKASVLGVPLPLCSCGVIPTAVYMARHGASKGAVISFLISTPQTGIDSIVATYGMLGWVFALYRPLVAFITGIAGGIIVNMVNANSTTSLKEGALATSSHEHHPEDAGTCCCNDTCAATKKTGNKLREMYDFAFKEFLDDIALHFIIGIILSGFISYFIPDDFFAAYHLARGFQAMLLMIVIGIPMYICATASIPIAVTLLLKGVSPGAVFVFLSVGPLTNAASLAILARIFAGKILAVYLGVSVVLAILFGSILDLLFHYYSLSLPGLITTAGEQSMVVRYTYLLLAGILAMLLVLSLYRKYFRKYFTA